MTLIGDKEPMDQSDFRRFWAKEGAREKFDEAIKWAKASLEPSAVPDNLVSAYRSGTREETAVPYTHEAALLDPEGDYYFHGDDDTAPNAPATRYEDAFDRIKDFIRPHLALTDKAAKVSLDNPQIEDLINQTLKKMADQHYDVAGNPDEDPDARREVDEEFKVVAPQLAKAKRLAQLHRKAAKADRAWDRDDTRHITVVTHPEIMPPQGTLGVSPTVMQQNPDGSWSLP
jgi:hypothetical protein